MRAAPAVPWTLGAPLLVLALAAPGCVVLARADAGRAPAAPEVRALPAGARVDEVLARLGAPTEVWLQPDGLLLLYRARTHEHDHVGLDPSRAVAFLALDPLVGQALSNLKLTFEHTTLREERVAVLLGRDGRVRAVAHRDREGRRLR